MIIEEHHYVKAD